MICLFEKTATDFSGNGIMTLNPISCVVAEVAGGSYVLNMQYPMDEDGKYLALTEERIIKAPVPPTHIPKIVLPNVTVWKTSEATNLYSVLPAYRRVPGSDALKDVRQNPSKYAWKSYVFYTKGSYVTQGTEIYQANYGNQGYLPGGAGAGDRWNHIGPISGNTDRWEQDGGTVLEILAAGARITKIADYNANYMQVRALSGNVGYVLKSACQQVQTEDSNKTIDAQDFDHQPFRIYKIGGEDDSDTITVEAKHISYDFQGNGLLKCEVNGVDPMTAISWIKASLVDEDKRLIACNISGKTVTQDWSFWNPINALLDPDSGLVPVLGAQLIRNEANIFILSNDSPRPGITIAYGHNMLGVRWSRDIENVITRVLPRCGDGNDGWLYIDKVYVESPRSMDYHIQRTEMMDCGFDVGGKYKDTNGVEHTYTAESAKAKMEEEAQNRFDVDNADAEVVELEVEFLLIGDTAEYAQYKWLQQVNLYDLITVVMDKSGQTATAQVAEYEYDCINRRYNSIKVGNIKTLVRRIPGYRLKRASITYDKLGNSVISKIKSATNLSGGES